MSEKFKKGLLEQYFRKRVIDTVEIVKSGCYNLKMNIIEAENTLSEDELNKQLKKDFYTHKSLGRIWISRSFKLDSKQIPKLDEDELDVMIKSVIKEFDLEKTVSHIEENIGGDFW
ncbi:hypothetical protein H0243_13705 [Staphylococcus sciuri]|uniref:hypothetical protein n=1 Tax=Mammaliicoccus sciuri TaxID=1296 RepID=UPI0018CA08D2|nr:hypothetical protein [Mammaliicoccus sciuri]MBG9206846.1 hypothetical protein [Mammaliicoccus sciuri]